MASSSTDTDGSEQQLMDLMDELVELCQSKHLSIESLKAKIKLHHDDENTLSLSTAYVHRKYSSRPFFHMACMNENVTLEIIEYLIELFPQVESLPTDLCPEETTTSYALHCACYNDCCPNEVVELLVTKNSVALDHFCWVGEGLLGYDYYDDGPIRGLPLHYYLARKNNVDIDILKMLVEACPETLMYEDYRPLIHVAISNKHIKINDLRDIIIFFLGQEQSSQMIRLVDRWNSTSLHQVCMKEGMTLEVFKLIFNAWPEAIRLGDACADLPIHELCCNEQLDDTASLDILRFMLKVDPTLVRETNADGYLPIHQATSHHSFAFCKFLIDGYPESVKVTGPEARLPIHEACYRSRDDTADTIQYLLELYPESLHARNEHGWLPIHDAACGGNVKTVELLLMHDPTAASKETTENSRDLPLHIDSINGKIGTVQLLFDAYPEGILTRNHDGKTPVDLAREGENSKVLSFLEAQLAYVEKAKDTTTMTTLDENGWLPLHHALKSNAPLGSIKLLVKGNPLAVRTADNNLAFPIHIACEFSSAKVVQFLAEKFGISVDQRDKNNDSILHYACRGGNPSVVKYLLESHAPLVASATVNAKGELPIHLLCESMRGEDDDSENIEYIETIWLLLLANPEVVMA